MGGSLRASGAFPEPPGRRQAFFAAGVGANGERLPGRKGLKVKGDIPRVGGSEYKGLWVGSREGSAGHDSGSTAEWVLRAGWVGWQGLSPGPGTAG